MTIYQFCLSETLNYNNRDAFVSDLALTSEWEDAETADIPDARLTWLSQLWDAAHRSVRDIAAASGLSQRKLADRFAIPYRTVENWCSNTPCPIYVKMLMQESLGLVVLQPPEDAF